MEYWVAQLATNLLTANMLTTRMLTTKLLAEIHRLLDHPLVLESWVDLALLKPCNLMILLGHLWKDLLSKPSTISIHRHTPC